MSNEKEQIEVTAEIETAAESGVGTYKLIKPTKIDGNIVTEINYNLANLNGKNIRHIRARLGRKGYMVSAKEIDSVLHAAMFADASGLTDDNIEALSSIDYMNVADIVRDFLLGEG